MSKPLVTVLYVLAMVVVIVGADVLFFQHHFTRRLITNILIVLAFGFVYVVVLKRHIP